MDLRLAALAALTCADPLEKSQLALDLHAQAQTQAQAHFCADLQAHITPDPAQPMPGRPARPALVHPAKVPKRPSSSVEGRAALLHAICHIEFNAINLALDAVWRFAGMPEAFYRDWLRVAAEEAKHFRLLHAHLGTLGYQYGDFLAHDGLWLMCEKTAHDIIARMALVPRTLEARGLDATPQIQNRLRGANTPDSLAAVAILDLILAEEIGHVAIGNHWYQQLCQQAGLDPIAHYQHLVDLHAAPRLHPPFNLAAREQAGFSPEEIAYLMADFSPS
jgi:uncharacterized ferritin-like protein (DUF455 family)